MHGRPRADRVAGIPEGGRGPALRAPRPLRPADAAQAARARTPGRLVLRTRGGAIHRLRAVPRRVPRGPALRPVHGRRRTAWAPLEGLAGGAPPPRRGWRWRRGGRRAV